MITEKKILFIVLTFFFLNNVSFADIKIIATIDNEIITNHDIDKERNYLRILNPNFSQLKDDQKMIIAKNYLIDQFIKKKEIEKFNIKESNKLPINDYLKNLYLRLGLNNEKEFKNLLEKNENYNLSEIKEKIKLELLWNDLIYRRYNDQVKINKSEILKKVNDMKKNINKEYFLSEILFLKKKNVTIKKLYEEIKLSIQEIGFNNTANIYSISDSSKFGGKIGWIDEISLSKNVREKLKTINKGEITDLIKLGNNFLILKIEDIKIKKTNIDEKKEIKRLTNLETNKQLSKFSKIYFNKSKLNYSINEK